MSLAISSCPRTRRNCFSAASIPAAIQRSRMSPARQRLTLSLTSPATLKALSMRLVLWELRAKRLGKSQAMQRQGLLQPLRKEAAAEGLIPSSHAAVFSNCALACS